MAALCLLGDDGAMIDWWEVTGRPMAIGRGETAEVVIDDETLSRRHFLIWRQGEKYFLKDLNSQNGTWVDGKAAPEALLHNNECIRAGHTLFLFSEHAGKNGLLVAAQLPTEEAAFLPAAMVAKRPAVDASRNR